MISAVIDLGSNTFHLLIVRQGTQDTDCFEVLHRETHFTALSSGGGGWIPEDVFKSALIKIELFAQKLNHFKPDHTKIVGTAVLRTAANSHDFVRACEKITGIKVDIISGETEAGYIAAGSLLHPELKSGNHLILDIGGGSTECICVCEGKIKTMKSFPFGVGVLKINYFRNDPATPFDLEKANKYFEEMTSEWLNTIKNIRFDSLSGASGTFESIENMVFGSCVYSPAVRKISTEIFFKIYGDIMPLHEEERKKLKGIQEKRALLLPAGLEIIHYFLHKIQPEKLLITHFSMKEGIAKKMAELG